MRTPPPDGRPPREADLVVAGAGPAGLAAAIASAAQGLQVAVFERRPAPLDKACGEGLMPAGAEALQRLGARALLSSADCAPFRGLRLIQEDGTFAEARFARGREGLGVRRTALFAALTARARQLGAFVRPRCPVLEWRQRDGVVEVTTAGGFVVARALVVATGLSRARGGTPSLRFGARRHYRLRPWSDHVEIYWSAGLEAYVTPAGSERVGVALLWDRARLGPRTFDALLGCFPALSSRLYGAPHEGEVRGAGPLGRPPASRLVAGRVVYLGDAAGAVDPISGEGIALAFRAAEALAARLPGALDAPKLERHLAGYALHCRLHFERARAVSSILLAGSRHPGPRRAALRLADRTGLVAPLLRLAADP